MHKLSVIGRTIDEVIDEVREKNYLAVILNNSRELVKVSCHFLEPHQESGLKLFLNRIFRRPKKINKFVFVGNRQTQQTQLASRYYEQVLDLKMGKTYHLVRFISSEGEILEGNHLPLN